MRLWPTSPIGGIVRLCLQVRSFLKHGARHAEHDRTDEALKLFDKAVSVSPTDVSVYRHRAAIYCQVRRTASCGPTVGMH